MYTGVSHVTQYSYKQMPVKSAKLNLDPFQLCAVRAHQKYPDSFLTIHIAMFIFKYDTLVFVFTDICDIVYINGDMRRRIRPNLE